MTAADQGSPPAGRERAVEDYLLQRAAGRVGEPLALGFPDAVRSRLKLGERRFGGSWRGRSTADSVREMQEEAEDLAAYGALAIQALDDVANTGTPRGDRLADPGGHVRCRPGVDGARDRPSDA